VQLVNYYLPENRQNHVILRDFGSLQSAHDYKKKRI